MMDVYVGVLSYAEFVYVRLRGDLWLEVCSDGVCLLRTLMPSYRDPSWWDVSWEKVI